MEKEVIRINKSRKEITKTISYRLQFIDSARFMQVYYQILLIILLTDFIELDANMDMIIKHMKHVELIIKIGSAFLNTQTLKVI